MHQPTQLSAQLTDRRERRRVRIVLSAILIPLALATAWGLWALWPHDVAAHIVETGVRPVPAADRVSGTLTTIAERPCAEGEGEGQNRVCADVRALLHTGPESGRTVDIDVDLSIVGKDVLTVGADIILVRVAIPETDEYIYSYLDMERRSPLLIWTIVFLVAVVLVARLRGTIAMIGLVFAGWVVAAFMLPALISGSDAVLVGLVGGSSIMFVCLYAAHGFSARTSVALLGTLFGLGLSAGLGVLATSMARISGIASEEDLVLIQAAPDLRLSSVVICGVVLASLGVLNDATVTQASAVWELHAAAPDDPIFGRAMRIGRDHIASSVYTIVFAATGAALPVMLLMAIYQTPLLDALTSEGFASEVIRTLVGSIGLVLAVPVTTLLGALVVRSARAAADRRE